MSPHPARPGLVVFDLYGTLLDLTSVLTAATTELGAQGSALLAQWRTTQLEYTWLRTLMGRYAPFDVVTAEALDFTLDRLGLAGPNLRNRLLASFRSLTPYPEVPGLLSALRQGGYPLAILSNGTADMIEAALSAASLRQLITWVISVEPLRQYKPAPPVYRLVRDICAVSPDDTLFVSANGWDAAGAAAAGLQTVWVNRTAAAMERLPASPGLVIPSLDGLRPLLGIAPAD
jgi:2-haloacid dehalogenase